MMTAGGEQGGEAARAAADRYGIIHNNFVHTNSCLALWSLPHADQISAALKLVAAGLSPTNAAHQVGLGRSTVYREIKRTGLQRPL